MNIAVLAIEACQKATGSKYVTCNVARHASGGFVYHLRDGTTGALASFKDHGDMADAEITDVIDYAATVLFADYERIIIRNEANDIRWGV